MIAMTKRGGLLPPAAQHGHPNPLEVVEAAVGVVDAAWTALEKHRSHNRNSHHHDGDGDHCQHQDEHTRLLERELDHHRSENERLRALLQELAIAVQGIQFHSPPPVVEDACPSNLHQQLQQTVSSTKFLEKLKDIQGIEYADRGIDPEDGSSWVWVPNDLYPKDGKEEPDGLGKDSYVIVSQDDVLEAVAAFVARVIISNPKAKKLSPEQLQQVVASSFESMETKGRLRKLWYTAKFLYASATWTTAAFGLYKNPIIVKALFRALFLSSRLVVKVLV